jgi:outer membrane lipoprotein-sorting protein
MNGPYLLNGIVALALSANAFAALDADTVRARVSANLDKIESYRADAIVSVRTG